jgi:hypothetical protein
MSRESHYDPADGEFVDFETLDDWQARDVAKDAELRCLEEANSLLVQDRQGTRPLMFCGIPMEEAIKVVLLHIREPNDGR